MHKSARPPIEGGRFALLGVLLKHVIAGEQRHITASAEATTLRDGSRVTIAHLTYTGGVARAELTYERHIVAAFLQNAEGT